jgi:catechol 2,3-dioxygenase-like lactoylglutathione lyase family enzyme
MDLGAFSVSLTVKNVEASKKFYEKLGFESLGGDCGQGWTILKNGDHVIGLFQGMFEKNMLTFNPGWDQSAQKVDEFTDVRALRDELIRRGITIVSDDAKQDVGPGSILIEDPDGNPILIDQHR